MSRLPCIVLAGGFGTRLAPVLGGLPKCLAPIGGRPFLALQLEALAERGAGPFVLALGHLASQVEAAIVPLRERHAIRTVVEPEPLGTGGALLNAMATCGLPECLAVNGDTWLDAELTPLVPPLDLAGGEHARMACLAVPDRRRYGGVVIEGRHVTAFVPQGTAGDGPINAGVYRLHTRAFGARAPGSAFSFERDVLPRLAAERALGAAALDGGFIDIGVPEDWRRLCQQAG
jgi:D-glycero-alpha-D-manno-heptose 1-phosphate guanylyltransferase